MITVLFIDDEENILEIAKLFLEYFDVEATTSTEKALKLIENKEKKYNVIISDNQMKCGMSGIDFLKTLKKNPSTKEIPFIFFSGGDEKVKTEAIKEGADYYFEKGGDPTTLFNDLRKKIEELAK